MLSLDESTVHAVLSVDELDQIAQGITNSTVIVDHDILQCFDETTLNVSRFSSLHSSIDKTFTTSHGVEEELLRREPTKIRVFHESAGLGTVVVLREMR